MKITIIACAFIVIKSPLKQFEKQIKIYSISRRNSDIHQIREVWSYCNEFNA